ncbi:MAG: PilZ domain-containing protein [Halomonas sp.]|uniref:HD domain-containing phosphohydrolase n=1 Tax=Halomonas sp. TaxID=1486246 RepID=UPI0019EB5A5F|nr:HD domain-containing phosphohydrolase [Halomonas sp.]MBE0488990.1 PilZ domain-containing protein [Halomonas sp.]
MTDAQEQYNRVTAPVEMEALLESLSQPGGASLKFDADDSNPLPVLVTEQVPGKFLLLDISAIREAASELKRGAAFRLLGQSRLQILRTPPLVVEECQEAGGRMVCRCPYPTSLEVLQRRETFRARLRLGMEVGAILRGSGDEPPVQGDLKDLSLEGCQLELPLAAASRLASPLPLEIELCFPNGTRFVVAANPRHRVADAERQLVRVGFQFAGVNGDQERQLWHFVREIEREAARQANVTDVSLLPSLLFQNDAAAQAPVSRRNVQHYATPMARRLARIAGYLDAQLMELKDGRSLDSVQLSRYADRLLALHDEDREALLFATRCLNREPLLVRHGLGVAVHLVDLATVGNMPRGVRKALLACAMVHDLGKALLPEGLLDATALNETQRAELQTHVALLEPRLAPCQWLAASVVDAVVVRINERLDGSGYPARLTGGRLGELTRLASIVDVVEAMRRDRPDRPAWKISAIYRYLLGHPERFDQPWVKRYIKYFGLLPIGSLVRFPGGELGWVQRLDGQGRPAQVQLTEAIEPPGEGLGEMLRGERLAKLGGPVEEVPVSV